MASWGPLTYTVGSSALSDFPMAIFKGVNDPVTIKFTASSSQTGAATLRIGTTLSFAGGRPQVKVNSFTGPAPSAPTNLNSRGVTRGAYRGLGEVYNVAIPAGTIVAGTNTVGCHHVTSLTTKLTGTDHHQCCLWKLWRPVPQSQLYLRLR
jgi:rhamnogalacturonan endolyase